MIGTATYVASTAAENFRLVNLKAGTSPTYDNGQKLTYTHDDNGNILTNTDAAATGGSQTQTFTYAPLARLQTAQATGGTGYGDYTQRTYAYSPAGNSDSWSGTAFTYQDTAHKHALTHIGGVQKYWYDANGNATRRISASQDITLTYDPENRLTDLTGGVTSSYGYDGDGNRVRELDDGVVRVFVGNLYERQYYLGDGSDGVAQKWTAATGTWAVTGGGYRQSATTSNTNAYRAWAQGSAFNYEWKATYTSGTNAGFYLFASASTGAERGNSYRIWQDATTVKLYESAGDVASQRASWAAANAAGQSHTYQVSYDPLTGSFSVKRDGATLGSWTDTTPLQNGSFVALRTDAANVLFDDIKITRESKYYYAGSQRVAVRHNGSAQVNYLLGDHLGSTALTTNQAGARLTELR